MDIVYISDLELMASIGIYDWEKSIKQKIRINLEMAWDNRVPAGSEQIEDALNYKIAAQQVGALVAERHYDLVETLAESIATLLLDEMNSTWVRVTVGKPGAVKNSREVGVSIEREQKP